MNSEHLNGGQRARLRARRGERGFILALGLLLMAAMALIGTASLSSASFQRDLANSSRANSQLYFSATSALGIALDQLLVEPPRAINLSLGTTPPTWYVVGGFDRNSGTVYSGVAGCAPNDRACICPVSTARDCIDFVVEVQQINIGNAPGGYEANEMHSRYMKVMATASAYSGAASKVAVYVAGVYRGRASLGLRRD